VSYFLLVCCGSINPAIVSSDLLHLVQPYALSNLRSVLQHVKKFRDYLGGKNPTTENSQMVKDVLLDVVDCSGIDLGALYTALEEFLNNPPLLDGESLLGRDPSSHFANL
jgi:hypothetical protein